MLADTMVVEKKPRGRREKNTQQDAVIDCSIVKEKADELIALYAAAESAADEFSEAIKATAESSGILAAVVRRWIVAKAGERYEDKKRECGQLHLLFEEE